MKTNKQSKQTTVPHNPSTIDPKVGFTFGPVDQLNPAEEETLDYYMEAIDKDTLRDLAFPVNTLRDVLRARLRGEGLAFVALLNKHVTLLDNSWDEDDDDEEIVSSKGGIRQKPATNGTKHASTGAREQTVLAFLAKHPNSGKSAVMRAVPMTASQWLGTMRTLRSQNKIKQTGDKSAATYCVV